MIFEKHPKAWKHTHKQFLKIYRTCFYATSTTQTRGIGWNIHTRALKRELAKTSRQRRQHPAPLDTPFPGQSLHNGHGLAILPGPSQTRKVRHHQQRQDIYSTSICLYVCSRSPYFKSRLVVAVNAPGLVAATTTTTRADTTIR